MIPFMIRITRSSRSRRFLKLVRPIGIAFSHVSMPEDCTRDCIIIVYTSMEIAVEKLHEWDNTDDDGNQND